MAAPPAMHWSRLNGQALAGAVLLLLGLLLLQATGARAQGAGILAPGDAVVTGFSGIKAPDAPVPLGGDPLDAFHIDLDGPSAQILQLGVPGAPPQGQLISVPAPYKARAREVGQVFAIALDDSPVPNIYLGQTSAFGLQIVGPDGDSDGRPDRLKQGGPKAQWMAGQFGTDTGGGPGSVYKIDGQSGSVSVFATIPGNGGAGLGDIVFDKASRQFFVSDLDTGLIHRIDISGTVIDSFDHGTAGRAAAGLPPVADDGVQANIKDAGFSVEDPATWGFAPKLRLVWGMAVHQGRLYYAVAEGPTIWSIGLGTDGSFAGDAREELQVADTPAGHAVSDIAFDGEGRMYLAQRGEIRGSYDYSIFAEPGQSVVRRYRREAADDPAAPAIWVAAPEEYAIGFPDDYRNTAGGIALGYAYDETGSIRRGTCSATLWATGDKLRNNEKHAAKLGDEGPLDVHGLQGSAVSLVRPQNEPPFQSYFVDYDGQFGDTGRAGHVGDVEIWQPCEGSPGFSELTPGYPPPGYVWPSDAPPSGVPPPPPGDWPPPGTPPPGDWPTNLRLKQKAVACWSIAGGKHRCGFIVTVTNTGPGVYHDHIKLRDTIPKLPGVTANFTGAQFNACPGGPPKYTCTTLAPVHLLPWEKVVLPVRVDVPDKLAKQLGCKVKNRARILHAPSPSDSNTDPNDDSEAATALLPAHLCQPQVKSNLRITNKAISCVPIGAGDKFKCQFNVRVRNLGPDVYSGKIWVTDTVPGGTTANFAGGWNCPGPGLGPSYLCKHNPVILDPIQSVLLKVSVNVSANRAKQLGCKVTNTAKIDFAPSPSDKNTNPADDKASATAVIPPALCDPPKAKSNLRITNTAGKCFWLGGKFKCGFDVRVFNWGPGVYQGKIRVTDTVPGGTTAKFGGGWNCPGPGQGPSYTCKHAPVVFAPGLLVHVPLKVWVDVPAQRAKQLGCKVTNTAKIDFAPSPSDKNTNPADDKASATAVIPPALCGLLKGKTNLQLAKGEYAETPNQSPNCPLVGNATWCKRFRVAVLNTGPGNFNGPIKVRDISPAALKWRFEDTLFPPNQWTCNANTRTCQTNGNVALFSDNNPRVVTFNVLVSGDDKDAKALNCKLNTMARILSPQGAPKNTNAGDDNDAASYDLPAKLCQRSSDVRPCPPGYRWAGDRCGPVIVPPPPPPPRCPPGTVGRYPDCERPPVVADPPRACPRGTVGRWPNCTRRECPRGTVGEWPNCRKRACPRGTVGTYPNCTKRECPRGTVGEWPNCRKRACPRGTVGTYPNCRRVDPPRKCPRGMVGRPPNCRRIVRPCPRGQVRVRGRCIKPAR